MAKLKARAAKGDKAKPKPAMAKKAKAKAAAGTPGKAARRITFQDADGDDADDDGADAPPASAAGPDGGVTSWGVAGQRAPRVAVPKKGGAKKATVRPPSLFAICG